MSKFIYQSQSHVIANGARLEIATDAKYLLILSWSGATDIDIEINDEPKQNIPAGLAINLLDSGDSIQKIAFINNTGGAATLEIALSNNIVDDNRTVISGSIATAETPASAFTTGQVSIDNTLTGKVIKASNASRKSITIKIPVAATEAVFIGPDNTLTALNGHRLDPGDAITLNNTAAIRGITAGAGPVVVTYDEET